MVTDDIRVMQPVLPPERQGHNQRDTLLHKIDQTSSRLSVTGELVTMGRGRGHN